MKVIDLLNKIANGDRPNFRFKGNVYIYDKFDRSYKPSFLGMFKIYAILNDEVEIIDGEEHKIPEKLKIEQDTPNSNFYIRNEYGTKCALTKHSKIIADKINGIIDYLEVNND